MKAIKIRSGGTAYILDRGDYCPPGAICFMSDEWEWAMKLSKSYVNDPEQLQSFWGTVMERKKDVPGYSVFMDFPQDLGPAKKGLEICAEILQMLEKHKNIEE